MSLKKQKNVYAVKLRTDYTKKDLRVPGPFLSELTLDFELTHQISFLVCPSWTAACHTPKMVCGCCEYVHVCMKKHSMWHECVLKRIGLTTIEKCLLSTQYSSFQLRTSDFLTEISETHLKALLGLHKAQLGGCNSHPLLSNTI